MSQAERSGLFARCMVVNDELLYEIFPDNSSLRALIAEAPRGHGLWAWKSIILSSAANGAFGKFNGIFYTDAGTELVTNLIARQRLKKLFSAATAQGIVTFQTNSLEYSYSKRAVLDLLVSRVERQTPQREATTIIVSLDDERAIELVHEWNRLCILNNFELLRDPVTPQESLDFIDHRHDQSILSILLKNWNIPSEQPNTPTYHNFHISLLQRLIYLTWPIWPIRNRCGVSQIKSWQNSIVISLIAEPLFRFRVVILRVTRLLTKIKFWILKRLGKLNDFA